MAVDAPNDSSSQPPSSGANGIVVKPRNCDDDAIRPWSSSGVTATRYDWAPALPAGLRSRPRQSIAPTSHGEDQKTSGTSSGTQLHATDIVRRPVRIRSMTNGAISAPTIPPAPAIALDHPDRGGRDAALDQPQHRDEEDARSPPGCSAAENAAHARK